MNMNQNQQCYYCNSSVTAGSRENLLHLEWCPLVKLENMPKWEEAFNYGFDGYNPSDYDVPKVFLLACRKGKELQDLDISRKWTRLNIARRTRLLEIAKIGDKEKWGHRAFFALVYNDDFNSLPAALRMDLRNIDLELQKIARLRRQGA